MTADVRNADPKPLTGRKVLAIAALSFGAIIAANLTLAYSAVQSFPGIEVKNGYIASQTFERDRAAQERLNWTTVASYFGGQLTISVLDATGAPAPIRDVAIHIGRPTTAAEQLDITSASNAKGWSLNVDLATGPWRLDLSGVSASGDRFRQHLMVKGAR